MDFSFSVSVPSMAGQVIYQGIRARVLIHNKGPSAAKLKLDKDEEITELNVGSAMLVEASSVRAIKDSGSFDLEVRIEFSEPIGKAE